MQKQLYIVIILLSIWCTSCKQQEAAPNFVPIATNNTLTPIITDVKMVKINGGEYKPFYGSNTALVKVAPFLVDERQVTNSEFLAFVKVNPQWRRSQVKRLYADTTYLHNWQNDTTLPKRCQTGCADYLCVLVCGQSVCECSRKTPANIR